MNEAVARIADSWEYVLPEIVLVATACVHFLAGPFLVSERGEAPAGLRHRWGGLALAGLLVAVGFWLNARPNSDAAPLGPFRLDELTWFVRGLSLASGIPLLLTAWNRVDDARAAEHHACLLLIVAGVSLVGAANDLVSLFLALELVSIPTYVLLYLGRQDALAQEAVLKYFLLSIFSSALVLFGFSYLYGVTGTTNLTAVYAALASKPAVLPPVLVISAAAVIAGLGFRITAVPFHFYAPDVFQGTSTGGAAMLSFVPKIAGFVVLLRVLVVPSADAVFWSLADRIEPVLWGLAVLSMTIGNVLAFLQTDVRRMMAYSSVAHAGYMLVGLAVASHTDAAVAGIPAMLFYLVAYGAMTVGVFAILAAVRSDAANSGSETIEDLAGLNTTHPVAAMLMTVFLFSLTGLPPTAGFLGKLNLFLAAWSAGTPSSKWLAVLMAINAAIAAWYYLRLIGVMYLQPPRTASRPVESPAFLGGALCAAATVTLFIAPDWLWQTVLRAGG